MIRTEEPKIAFWPKFNFASKVALKEEIRKFEFTKCKTVIIFQNSNIAILQYLYISIL